MCLQSKRFTGFCYLKWLDFRRSAPLALVSPQILYAWTKRRQFYIENHLTAFSQIQAMFGHLKNQKIENYLVQF